MGYSEPPKPLSAIEDFCERFDKAVKNNYPKVRTLAARVLKNALSL